MTEKELLVAMECGIWNLHDEYCVEGIAHIELQEELSRIKITADNGDVFFVTVAREIL
jgi:hypothetical protein